MSDNILEPIANLLIKSCKSVYNIFANNKKFDFDNYFKIVGINTVYEDNIIKPKLVANYETNKGEKYIYTIPTGFGIDRLNSYKSGMEIAIGNPIIFSFEGSQWIIEIIKNKLNTVIPYYENPVKSDSIKIAIGESLNGVEYLDLKESPNTFIAGTTGSGKSVCTKSIICSIISSYPSSKVHLYLADLKRVELNLFSNIEHTKKFVYKLDDVTQLIVNTLEECEERYDLFLKHNVTSIFEYNKLKRDKLPFKILFIEEIVLLLQDKKNVGMKALKELMSICRASGIYVFISTQRPSADVIDTVVKANINNRICFRTEDIKNSIIALDCEGAENIQYKGRGFFKSIKGIEEFQSYYISDEQVENVILKHRKKEVIKTNSKQIGFIEKSKDNIIDDLSFLDKL